MLDRAMQAEARAVRAEDALRDHTGSLLGRVRAPDVDGGFGALMPVSEQVNVIRGGGGTFGDRFRIKAVAFDTMCPTLLLMRT